jgi:dolichol kinase
MALRSRLYPAYERLGERLAAFDIHVPSLRPSNTPRSLMHVAMSVVVIAAVVLWVHTPARMVGITAAVAASAWVLEATRRLWPAWNEVLMRILGPVAHDHERHRVNSATWYSSALLALAVLGDPLAAVAAFAVLGAGDPMAGLIGRRFGSHKLINGRSMEGTLAFAGFGGLAAFVVLAALMPITVSAALLLAVVAGVAGSLAELVARKIDDNLLIPVVVGLVTWIAASALGV